MDLYPEGGTRHRLGGGVICVVSFKEEDVQAVGLSMLRIRFWIFPGILRWRGGCCGCDNTRKSRTTSVLSRCLPQRLYRDYGGGWAKLCPCCSHQHRPLDRRSMWRSLACAGTSEHRCSPSCCKTSCSGQQAAGTHSHVLHRSESQHLVCGFIYTPDSRAAEAWKDVIRLDISQVFIGVEGGEVTDGRLFSLQVRLAEWGQQRRSSRPVFSMLVLWHSFGLSYLCIRLWFKRLKKKVENNSISQGGIWLYLWGKRQLKNRWC